MRNKYGYRGKEAGNIQIQGSSSNENVTNVNLFLLFEIVDKNLPYLCCTGAVPRLHAQVDVGAVPGLRQATTAG